MSAAKPATPATPATPVAADVHPDQARIGRMERERQAALALKSAIPAHPAEMRPSPKGDAYAKAAKAHALAKARYVSAWNAFVIAHKGGTKASASPAIRQTAAQNGIDLHL